MNAVIAKSALIVTLAAACIGHSALVHAERADRGSTQSITIHYGELDLSKAQGLEVLYKRIKRAARFVCGSDRSPLTTSRARHAMECYQDTLEDAVRQVNRPRLTALHRAKTKSGLG